MMTLKEIKKNEKYLDLAYSTPKNDLRGSRNETFEHWIAKACLCYELMQNEKTFVTEAIFTNKKRADIFNLSDGEILEVLNSEKQENIDKKQKYYPAPIRPFNAKEVIKQSLKAYMGLDLD